MIVRTFSSVFPYTFIVSTIHDTDTLLIGSAIPFTPDLNQIAQRMAQAEVRKDLADARVGVHSPFQLAARFRIGPREIAGFADTGPKNTDDLPIVAYRSPFDLYRDTRQDNSDLLAKHAKGIAPYLRRPDEDDPNFSSFYSQLAKAYRSFLPNGNESRVCDELANIR